MSMLNRIIESVKRLAKHGLVGEKTMREFEKINRPTPAKPTASGKPPKPQR